jgi:DNA-binding response OmpR family regulator
MTVPDPDPGIDEAQPQSILIVDDTPANIGVLMDYLKDAGFRILVARDGMSAIDIASYAHPDLILLDVMMPGINGFETCRRLKKNPSLQDIPVIFATALSDTIDKVQGFQAGGVDYITKPYQCEEVLARIQTHQSLSRMKKILLEQNTRLESEIAERKKYEEALNKANRQLSLLSGITRHDILNKVALSLLYLDNAVQQCTDPGLSTSLENIVATIEAIQSHIEFTRVYEDLGVQKPQWVQLDSIMPRSQVPASISLTTDLQNMLIFADPMVEKVFFNLLDNAIRHGERVTGIRVSAVRSGTSLMVVWEDNGIGIAAEVKERIFERGFGNNLGFGMFLAREILSLTDIAITETGIPGKGARFEILVPEGGWKVSKDRKTS